MSSDVISRQMTNTPAVKLHKITISFRRMKEKKSSFEPDLNQRPMDNNTN